MEEKKYYDKTDIAEIMGVSISKAYNIIRGLNLKLMEEKKLTKDCISFGKISKKYFHENMGY